MDHVHPSLNNRKVINWFSTLKRATRIELICGLLQFCSPIELRFYGSCLEELGRHDYNHLKPFEIRANADEPSISFESFKEALIKNMKNKTCTSLIVSRGCINNIIIAISLLRSNNNILANYYYSCIMADHYCDGYNGNSFNEGLIASWEFIEDIILIYSIASYHPAFSHFQKYRLFERLRAILYLYLKRERGVNICKYNSEFLENSSLLSFLDEFSKTKNRRSSVPWRNKMKTTDHAAPNVNNCEFKSHPKENVKFRRRTLSEDNLMINYRSKSTILDSTLSSVEGKYCHSFDSNLKNFCLGGFLSECGKSSCSYSRLSNLFDQKSFKKQNTNLCCMCTKLATLKVDCSNQRDETSSSTSKKYQNSIESCLSPPNSHQQVVSHVTRNSGSCSNCQMTHLPRRHSSASSHLSTPPSEDYLINSLHSNFTNGVVLVDSNNTNNNIKQNNTENNCNSPSNCFDKTITSSDSKAFEKIISSTNVGINQADNIDNMKNSVIEIGQTTMPTQSTFPQICLISPNTIPAYVSHPGLAGIPFDVNCIDPVNQGSVSSSAVAAALFAQSNFYQTPITGVYPQSTASLQNQSYAAAAAFLANQYHMSDLQSNRNFDNYGKLLDNNSGKRQNNHNHQRISKNGQNSDTDPEQNSNKSTTSDSSLPVRNLPKSTKVPSNYKNFEDNTDDTKRKNHSHPKRKDYTYRECPMNTRNLHLNLQNPHANLLANFEEFFTQNCHLGHNPSLFPIDAARMNFDSTSSDQENYTSNILDESKNIVESNSTPNLNNTNEFPQLPKPSIVYPPPVSESIPSVSSSSTLKNSSTSPGINALAKINNNTTSSQVQSSDEFQKKDQVSFTNEPREISKSSDEETRSIESQEEFVDNEYEKSLKKSRSKDNQTTMTIEQRGQMTGSSWSSVIGSSSNGNGANPSSKADASNNTPDSQSTLNPSSSNAAQISVNQSSTPNKNFEIQNNNNLGMSMGNSVMGNYEAIYAMPQRFNLAHNPSLLAAPSQPQYFGNYGAYSFNNAYTQHNPTSGANPQAFLIATPQFAAYNLFPNIQNAAFHVNSNNGHPSNHSVNNHNQNYRYSQGQTAKTSSNSSTSQSSPLQSNSPSNNNLPNVSSSNPVPSVSSSLSNSNTNQNNSRLEFSPAQSPSQDLIVASNVDNFSNQQSGKLLNNQFSKKTTNSSSNQQQQQHQMSHGNFSGICRMPPPVHAGIYQPPLNPTGGVHAFNAFNNGFMSNFLPATTATSFFNPVINFVNNSNNPNNKTGRNSRVISCYHCGNSGHKASQCTVSDRNCQQQQQINPNNMPTPSSIPNQSFNLDFNRSR